MDRISDISIFNTFLILLIVSMALVGFADAQEQTPEPDCASKLASCAEFLKSDKPPPSCCNPIKETVATQLDCLCNLYTTPGLLKSFGVNVTDALHLTEACGVPAVTSKCKNLAAAPPNQAGTGTPPAVPGNGADKLALIGFTSILMFWASLILC